MILRSMRSGFFSKAFLGLLVLGGASLVFADWNGMFHGSGINKTDVAKIDGTPIKISEFNNRASHIIRNQQIDPTTAYKIGLIDNILSNEIYDIQMKKNALDLGIRVEDRIVAEQIKQLIAPVKKDGMDDKAALKQFLEMQGLTEQQLVASLRDELTSNILKSAISSGIYAPQSLVNSILAYKHQTRNIDIAFFPNADIAIKETPSDKDLETYYQSISSSFMVPESRDVTIAVLDTSKIAKPAVTDEDIKAAFEDNQDKFTVPEQAELEQALLSDEAKAKQIVEAVKSGKSLKDAVKAVTGDEKAYQAKNSFGKDGLPTDISTPVFAAKSGDVIGPIKSPLGFHVIQLDKLVAAHTADIATVKDSIRKELEAEKASNAVYDITSKIEDGLANGEKFENLTTGLPMTLLTLKNLNTTSAAPKELAFAGKNTDIVMKKIFAVQEGAASELTEVSDNALFSVRLDKLTPAAPQPFAKVKEEILRKWKEQNQIQENLLKTQKLVDDLNNGKEKAASLKITTLKDVSRQSTKEIAKDVIDSMMAAETGKYIMAISREKSGIYVARVNSVTLPKAEATQSADARKQIESDMANASFMTYLGSLQSKYPATINSELLKRAYDKSESTE